ncbi:MBL fold metallo-hydrolase [Sphingomonas sp. TREG-RG-20F-R18-01]|uniref:MBL fold metallo-hydrolase n=1 Tax=Sphingomonas sp. TREG-RG-20F-R18-01 TaxID=2914982 RepID=UPI001F56D2A0|nr:MBL fold metallo-hydrolase [Sphingomonas sp. TREG-RG-20F-R18-01]
MTLRSIAALGFAVFLGSPVLAKPVPIAPAAVPFGIGAVRVVALRDMINRVPNDGSVFGKTEGPAAVADILRKAGAPTDAVSLGVDALLVRMPGRMVLIDAGLGPKVGGVLMQSLALAKVSPTDITDILITHSHGDHVGGLSDADGKLAFPNATIRMTRAEWAFLQSKPDNAALVATIAPKVMPFDPGAVVMPGIRAVELAGHTPGHSGYEITSNGQKLLDMGDTAHSAIVSLARPEWIIGYDTDGVQGRQRRMTELAKLAASGEYVFSPHFPFPGLGRIVKAGTAYRWQPLKR